ncbi:DNA-binding domain superfamily [Sesbania bispinosa]|nr:DNA-binding domain superfamily [Sesbania bispinosa]
MVKQSVEKPAAERSDSLYRGVRKRKWGKFVSEIRLPNSRQRIWLGSYDTAEKAARAFDAAMFCLRGSSGRFNFPGDLPDITDGRSMTHSQIQTAAARFAHTEPRKNYTGQPVTIPQESFSSSEGTISLPMESPSPPLSEVTVQTDYDVTASESLSDLFSVIGSGNFEPDYSVFPGFDDFGSDFYVPELPSFDYGAENMDGLIIEGSFLWNF